jgi:NMD protein affecting ribosome stability and mRNA decay
MKFCAKCGARGDTKDGLCDKCHTNMNPLLEVPKQMNIKSCEGCGNFLHRNLWKRYPTTEDAVESILRDSIKTRRKIKIQAKADDEKAEAEVDVDDGKEKHSISIKIEESICHKCRKLIGKYFEGVLQLRDVDEKVLDYVAKDIESNADNGVFVKEIIEHKTGMDLQVTSRKYLMGLGKKLRKRFGGTVKRTSRLFSKSRETSKEIHRLTVLYRGNHKREIKALNF